MTEPIRLLLIEDDPALRQVTTLLLRNSEYEVFEAGTGQDGLRLARLHHPDIVLLDVILPDIDGIEVCRLLKSDPALTATFVLLISSIARDSEFQAMGIELGADDYIARPMANRELLARVGVFARLCRRERQRVAALAGACVARETPHGSATGDSPAGASAAQEQDAILTAVADGLVIYDHEGRIQRCNPAGEQLLGFSPEEQKLSLRERLTHIRLETPSGELISAEGTPTMRAFAGEVVHGMEMKMSHHDSDRWLSVSSAPIPDADGRIQGVVVSLSDITARKTIEQQLRESEADVKALLNATSDGVFLLDPDGTILVANEPFARRFGQTAASILGQRVMQYLSDTFAATCRQHVAEVMAAKEGRRFEALEQERWLDITIYPITDTDGTVRRLALYSRDITERKQMEERLNYLAYYDHLTGLPNRFMLQDRLTQVMARLKRQQMAAGVLFLDLDNFKTINDTLGHSAGDAVLQEVARRLQQCVRECDTVARMGGDEFIILLTDLLDPHADAEVTARRIQAILAPPCMVMEHTIPLASSIGIALIPNDGTSSDLILKHADTAMYRAKERGRNQFCFYQDHVVGPFTHKRTLEHALRAALAQGEFHLQYQPQRDANKEQVIAVEAFLRWDHPELGIIPPLQFLPVIDETPLAEEIGTWVLQSACTQVARWRAEGQEHLRMAVNISPGHVMRATLPESIAQALDASALPAHALEIELPEFLIARMPERIRQLTKRLHEMGVRVTLDDVGLGYCAFDYLPQYPLTAIKIDGSFMRHIVDDVEMTTTVRTLIDIGRRHHLTTVAECVETPAQLAILRAHGCDIFQGFLYSRPLSPEAFAAWIKNQG
jgi:diguanylate cyclase (GGDEF)-like protein/PAS domain S-box-containing protein